MHFDPFLHLFIRFSGSTFCLCAFVLCAFVPLDLWPFVPLALCLSTSSSSTDSTTPSNLSAFLLRKNSVAHGNRKQGGWNEVQAWLALDVLPIHSLKDYNSS